MYANEKLYIEQICKLTCEKYNTSECICNIKKQKDKYNVDTMHCENYIPNINFEEIEKERKVDEIAICRKKKIRKYET